MELLVMLVGEDAILPKPEFLDDVELRFQVPSGSVGLADPGVAVGYGDHAVNLAQGPLCRLRQRNLDPDMQAGPSLITASPNLNASFCSIIAPPFQETAVS